MMTTTTTTTPRKITLYTFQPSMHSQYARVVLDEVGIDYTKVNIELPLENIKPEFAMISDALSLPAMTVVDNEGNSKTYTDSRDIINYCSTLPGNSESETTLFPKDKIKDMEEILDLIYIANGGRISFQAKRKQNILFAFAMDKMSIYRKSLLKQYLNDPKNSNISNIYKDALNRADLSSGNLNELIIKANNTMLFLDTKLEQSNGNYLLGTEYTAVDGIVGVWLYWIIQSNLPQIILSSRIITYYEKVTKRPKWNITNVSYAPNFITTRLYIVTSVIVCSAIVSTTFIIKKLTG